MNLGGFIYFMFAACTLGWEIFSVPRYTYVTVVEHFKFPLFVDAQLVFLYNLATMSGPSSTRRGRTWSPGWWRRRKPWRQKPPSATTPTRSRPWSPSIRYSDHFAFAHCQISEALLLGAVILPQDLTVLRNVCVNGYRNKWISETAK